MNADNFETDPDPVFKLVDVLLFKDPFFFLTPKVELFNNITIIKYISLKKFIFTLG